MNDQELRALVRDAVARHMGVGEPPPKLREGGNLGTSSHPSHGLYVALVNATDACIIEPSVMCEHCGYCKSHGH